jgi:hypothetical protein
MMDFDLRTKRLENEHKKIKEEAKRKLQQEKLLQEKQLQRQKELEALRIEQEELREKQRLEKEAIELHEAQLTNGISFTKAFANQHIYEIDNSTTENEYGDKIILSEDCLLELTNLDVFQRDSSVNFQLEIFYKIGDLTQKSLAQSAIRKMITYCGINEFTAPKEMIGLSPKIIDTLKYHSTLPSEEIEKQYFNPFIPPFSNADYNSSSTSSTFPSSISFFPSSTSTNNPVKGSNVEIIEIRLKYMKLPKCTYIKLKPKFHNFYHIEAIKRCLEENLSFHTSITLNDLLMIKYRGESYPLLVTDMKPERYGSLLNTDVEVDFDYSEEYESKKQEESQKGRTISSEPSSGRNSFTSPVPASSASVEPSSFSSKSVGYKLGKAGIAIEEGSSPMDISSSSNNNTEILSLLSDQSVIEEPQITSENKDSYLLAKFKLPNGKSLVRKFLYSALLLDIFIYVIQEMKIFSIYNEDTVGNLQLSISNPTKVFALSETENLRKSLTELDLNVKTQLFFVGYQ